MLGVTVPALGIFSLWVLFHFFLSCSPPTLVPPHSHFTLACSCTSGVPPHKLTEELHIGAQQIYVDSQTLKFQFGFECMRSDGTGVAAGQAISNQTNMIISQLMF